jgi:hypothetical protein
LKTELAETNDLLALATIFMLLSAHGIFGEKMHKIVGIIGTPIAVTVMLVIVSFSIIAAVLTIDQLLILHK